MSEVAAVEEVVLPNKEDFVMGEEVDDTPPAEEAPQEVELSDIEQKAHDMGWRPQEEWDGDASQWVDAKEFVGRQPLYDGLSKQSKEIKTMRKMLESLTEQNKRIQENAKKEALQELEQQRLEAIREGDAERVVQLEDQAKKVEAEGDPEVQAQQGGESAKFVEWRESNEWYTDKPDLRIYADAYGSQLYNSGQFDKEEDLYAEVERKVKEVFATEFSSPAKKLPNRGNPTGGQGAGKQAGVNDKWHLLTSEQKKMCKEFVGKGLFKNTEEYIKSLEAANMIEEVK